MLVWKKRINSVSKTKIIRACGHLSGKVWYSFKMPQMERFCFCGIPHAPWYTVVGKQESKKKKRKKSTTRLENIEENTI